LITVGGKVSAALKGREVHVCIDVNKWQGLASFPIFWVNVMDAAARGSSGWTIARTGQPIKPPPGSRIGTGSVAADGTFIAYKVGPVRLHGPDGEKVVYVNLLDERESDTAGETRAPDWNPSAPEGRIRERQSLAGSAAWCALAFLLLAWLLQLRPE